MSDTGKPAVKVRVYRLRNRLRDKTAGLAPMADMIELDPAALAAAEAVFASMSEDYPDWVAGVVQNLADLYRKCIESPEQRRVLFEQISQIAHDLKGQGGTFGYPLITAFATSLNRFSASRRQYLDSHVEIIKAHVDAMRAVIRDRISGDGGPIGTALTLGLEQVINHYTR